MLKIRLQRLGRRHRAFYRLVLTDARVKRQGKYLEKLGHYDPMVEGDKQVVLDLERLQHWMKLGAQPTDKAASLLKRSGFRLNASRAAAST